MGLIAITGSIDIHLPLLLLSPSFSQDHFNNHTLLPSGHAICHCYLQLLNITSLNVQKVPTRKRNAQLRVYQIIEINQPPINFLTLQRPSNA